MANGKAKGSGFEREIAKKLSLWWSEGKDDSLFWRTQNSGGRFTVRKKAGLQTEGQAGDISSTSPETKSFIDTFVVELKSYKDINLWSIITGSKGTIVDWWSKLSEESKKEDKIPLLIVKENFKPILLFTNDFFTSRLYLSGVVWVDPKMSLNFSHFDQTVNMYLFEDLFKLSPVFMKDFCREYFEYRRKI